MLPYSKTYKIQPEPWDEGWILKKADRALTRPWSHITDVTAAGSSGTIHDYYSNGDYWWPNPDTPDGLPYVHRDGQSNPDNFQAHRKILRRMRTDVTFLAAAWKITGKQEYGEYGVQGLKEFFLDPETRMNPNLDYAQALPGICPGRGIGIIDTLHLIDVVMAAETLRSCSAMTDEIYQGLRQWFEAYLGWMLTSANGRQEINATNNHSVCFFVQAAAFALFTENRKIADFCRWQFKTWLMNQMAPDGSFPRELGRTKPYSYSLFVVDNMVTLCHLLSDQEDDLWEYTTPDGRSISKALEYILPYILDKGSWPYPPDVMHFEAFPARASFMKFAGCRLGIKALVDVYQNLPPESEDEEARRNLAIRIPELWM